MRVVQINTVCGIGSTGRIAVNLAEEVNSSGGHSLIIYGRGEAKSNADRLKIGSKLCVYRHVLGTRLFDKHGLYSAYATKKAIKAIIEFNPDIIHLHNIHGYYLNYKILFTFLKSFGKPVVWTLHDCWAYTGHCAYYNFIGCEKWQTKCFHCPQNKTYPKSFADRSKHNFEDKKKAFCGVDNLTVVTPSQWLKDEVGKSFLKDYDIKIINNGIDSSIFFHRETAFKQKYEIADNKMLLGVANVWDKRKGLDTFIKLSKELPADYKIVLIGLSDKQIKEIPKNIIALGKTSSASELAEIYSAADIFLNPTLEDNYPTVNLEAEACGTPVITYDSGGSKETLKDERSIAVESDNFDKLFQAIVAFDFGADSTLLTSYSAADSASQYFKLYEEIISI